MKTLSYVSSLHQITEPALLVQQLMVPHPALEVATQKFEEVNASKEGL